MRAVFSALFTVALLTASCSTTLPRNASLDSARAAYAGVSTTPDLSVEARYELKDAESALRAAEDANQRKEDRQVVEHLAYLAKQRAVAVQEREAARRAEQRVERRVEAAAGGRTASRDEAAAPAPTIVSSQSVAAVPPAQGRDLERREMLQEARRDAATELQARDRAVVTGPVAAAPAPSAASVARVAEPPVARRSAPAERPMTDAERRALVAKARRAALAESEERAREATAEAARREAAAESAARSQRTRSAPFKERTAVTKSDRERRAAVPKQAAKAAVPVKQVTESVAPPKQNAQDNAPPKPAPADAGKPEVTRQSAAMSAAKERGTRVAAAPPAAAARANADASATAWLNVPPRGSVVTLKDDLFHAGAPYLRPGATRAIDPVADYLRANPNRNIRIDAIAPGVEHALSKGRADEVRSALLRRGVAAERIQIAARSAPGERDAARVEILISDQNGRIAVR